MSERTRILYTIPNFDTAGSGKVVYDLANGLDKTKFEIAIACGNDLGEFFKEVEALEVPIHIFKTKTSYKPYYNLFFRIWHISKFYKEQQFDIIHSWQWSSDWTEALAAKLAGVKYIYTKKAMGFESKHWKIRSYLADFIVTINDEMRGYFPKKKEQALIPLGIDTDYYNPELFNWQTLIDDANFHIITVANLVPVKGIEVLLKALKILKSKNVSLTIVGDNSGPYGATLTKMVLDLKLDQQVAFLGKKADVRPFIAEADVYVIPTLDEGRKEGMPMALVEAMCMGIPVLGSDISGIRYVLKEFKDLLFPALDSVALAKKIDVLYNQTPQERNALGIALREYCLSNFNMKKFIKSHETVYNDLFNAT